MIRTLTFTSYFILIFFTCCHCDKNAEHYTVILDAGSSGTRVHVYKIKISPDNKLPEIKSIASCQDSDPSSNTEGAGCKSSKPDHGINKLINSSQAEIDAYLAPLLNFAKSFVPDIYQTPIYLRATAGVRNLKNSNEKALLMKMATETLKKSGFISKDAKTITGEDEGIYAWTTINYIKKTLGKKNEHTFGIIGLGGESEQIAFATGQDTSKKITIADVKYNIYSYSYSHLGVNTANKIPIEACDREGKINYNECKFSWAKTLIKNNFCHSNCGLEGIHQPAHNGKFVLFGATPGGLANRCKILPFNPKNISVKGKALCSAPPLSYNPYRLSEEQIMICGSNVYPNDCKILAMLDVELTAFGFKSDTLDLIAPDKNYMIDGEETTWTIGFLFLEQLAITSQQ